MCSAIFAVTLIVYDLKECVIAICHKKQNLSWDKCLFISVDSTLSTQKALFILLSIKLWKHIVATNKETAYTCDDQISIA